MILDGIAYSFGILLTALMEYYGEGKGLIAMVKSSFFHDRFHLKIVVTVNILNPLPLL
jgi:hypothetical protein